MDLLTPCPTLHFYSGLGPSVILEELQAFSIIRELLVHLLALRSFKINYFGFVFGIVDASDGRLTSQDNPSVTYRRPNPSEWTGEDFPSLQSTRPMTTSSHLATNEPRSPQTPIQRLRESTTTLTEREINDTNNSVQNKRPIMGGSWVSRVANVNFTNKDRLTSEDFPSLTQSTNPSTGKMSVNKFFCVNLI